MTVNLAGLAKVPQFQDPDAHGADDVVDPVNHAVGLVADRHQEVVGVADLNRFGQVRHELGEGQQRDDSGREAVEYDLRESLEGVRLLAFDVEYSDDDVRVGQLKRNRYLASDR